MSLTVDLEENQNVRLTNQLIEKAPPAQVEFAVEGVISMAEELLEEFEGSSLKPVEIKMSVEEARTVEIDLSEEASLQLDTVDVGVATPDTDDLPSGMETISSSTDDSSADSDAHPGTIAFTVKGTITDVPEGTRELVTDASPRLKAITFAVEDPIRSDGGSGTDVILEISLFGYGIAVHRDGTIDIGTGRGATVPGLS